MKQMFWRNTLKLTILHKVVIMIKEYNQLDSIETCAFAAYKNLIYKK